MKRFAVEIDHQGLRTIDEGLGHWESTYKFEAEADAFCSRTDLYMSSCSVSQIIRYCRCFSISEKACLIAG